MWIYGDFLVDFYENGEGGPKKPHKNSLDPERRAAAVALKKEGRGAHLLPKITAAGYGKLAEEIVAIAFSNGVRVREDADLAGLLAAIEVDSPIPTEALVAVAEILAYVYKANGTYQTDGINDQAK